jgi:hypothetical protein
MGRDLNLVKAEPLEHFAVGKLSTRATFIREIQERVQAELVSESEHNRSLNGPLGEQIAIASGSFSLEFTDPGQLVEGICAWLQKTFLLSPQDFDPRAEIAACSPASGVPSKSSEGGGDGLSRVVAPEDLAIGDHCPFCGQDVPVKAVV